MNRTLVKALSLGAAIILIVMLLMIWVKPLDSEGRNEFIRTIAQVLGGGALLSGLYFTYQNLLHARKSLTVSENTGNKTLENAREALAVTKQSANESAKIAKETLEAMQEHNIASLKLERERILNDRFYQAVEQLGHQSESVRIGALYTLDVMSRESDEQYVRSTNMIAAFLRQRSRAISLQSGRKGGGSRVAESRDLARPRIYEELNVGIQLLAKRNHKLGDGIESEGIDLSGVKFDGITLYEADFQLTNFSNASMINTKFVKCNLSYTQFTAASLQHAQFINCSLNESQLSDANMTKSIISMSERSSNPYAIMADIRVEGDSKNPKISFMRPHSHNSDERFPIEESIRGTVWDQTITDDLYTNIINFSQAFILPEQVDRMYYQQTKTQPPSGFPLSLETSRNMHMTVVKIKQEP